MDKEHIVQRLARQLTDEVLEEIFPHAAPQTIRDTLLDKRTISAHPSPATGRKTETIKLSGCKLFTDGASRGNPGPAGAGVVLLDDRGQELLAKAEYLGHCTNNVAEYQALILGLRCAREFSCPKPAIFLDSELIVRQITGRYKVKSETLKPLFTEAEKLLQEFEEFTIAHVPRAQNARADELANRGIDEKDRD